MATERERCIFCTREKATEDDWNHPAMENDEPHAELDALCWDPTGEDACADYMLGIGRPANLEDALPYVDRLSALQAELNAEVQWLRTPGNIIGDHAIADRLEQLLREGK